MPPYTWTKLIYFLADIYIYMYGDTEGILQNLQQISNIDSTHFIIFY